MRPITLAFKNHLFAGSDGEGERWATVCSLITTAKLNGVEPYACLKVVLECIANGGRQRRQILSDVGANAARRFPVKHVVYYFKATTIISSDVEVSFDLFQSP